MKKISFMLVLTMIMTAFANFTAYAENQVINVVKTEDFESYDVGIQLPTGNAADGYFWNSGYENSVIMTSGGTKQLRLHSSVGTVKTNPLNEYIKNEDKSKIEFRLYLGNWAYDSVYINICGVNVFNICGGSDGGWVPGAMIAAGDGKKIPIMTWVDCTADISDGQMVFSYKWNLSGTPEVITKEAKPIDLNVNSEIEIYYNCNSFGGVEAKFDDFKISKIEELDLIGNFCFEGYEKYTGSINNATNEIMVNLPLSAQGTENSLIPHYTLKSGEKIGESMDFSANGICEFTADNGITYSVKLNFANGSPDLYESFDNYGATAESNVPITAGSIEDGNIWDVVDGTVNANYNQGVYCMDILGNSSATTKDLSGFIRDSGKTTFKFRVRLTNWVYNCAIAQICGTRVLNQSGGADGGGAGSMINIGNGKKMPILTWVEFTSVIDADEGTINTVYEYIKDGQKVTDTIPEQSANMSDKKIWFYVGGYPGFESSAVQFDDIVLTSGEGYVGKVMEATDRNIRVNILNKSITSDNVKNISIMDSVTGENIKTDAVLEDTVLSIIPSRVLKANHKYYILFSNISEAALYDLEFVTPVPDHTAMTGYIYNDENGKEINDLNGKYLGATAEVYSVTENEKATIVTALYSPDNKLVALALSESPLVKGKSTTLNCGIPVTADVAIDRGSRLKVFVLRSIDSIIPLGASEALVQK